MVEAGHTVAAVYTQPDRPKGRGQQVVYSPVKQAALARGLQVRQPLKIRDCVEELRALAAEVMVIVGYGQIIPQSILDLAPIINVHASLLPRYRGAAPIQWALAEGETVTGVTTMKIDAGLDTGDILMKAETPVDPEENAVELGARLAEMGARLLIETLATNPAPVKQNDAEATYARILKKEDGVIDWSLAASTIHNRVRGFQPWPGGVARFRGQTLLVHRTRVAEAAVPPGTLRIERKRLLAGCGGGTALELIELQLEGRKRLGAAEFLNGHRVVDNEVLA
jgi:methionyl-tRNA formyltransferase